MPVPVPEFDAAGNFIREVMVDVPPGQILIQSGVADRFGRLKKLRKPMIIGGTDSAAVSPGRGTVMADQAFTPERRKFAEALSTKAHGAKSMTSKAAGAVAGKAKEIAGGLWNSAPVAGFRGLLSSAVSFLGRQLGRLGTIGVTAAVATAVTSKQGQYVVGKVLGFAARVADNAAQAVIKVISWVPFAGPRIAPVLTRGRQVVNNKMLDLVLAAKRSIVVQAFLHDGIISRNVRRFALPYAMLLIIRNLLSGPYKLAGYAVFAGWLVYKAANSTTVGALAYGVGKRVDGWLTADEAVSKVRSEKIDGSVSATDTPAGPELDDEIAAATASKLAEQNHRTEDHIADVLAANVAKRDTRTRQADVIAEATINFLNDDKRYSTESACKAALKGLVHPAFKSTDLSRDKANKAATEFAAAVCSASSSGEGAFAEGVLDRDAQLIAACMNMALEAMTAAHPISDPVTL